MKGFYGVKGELYGKGDKSGSKGYYTLDLGVFLSAKNDCFTLCLFFNHYFVIKFVINFLEK
jgi:hypothetical protein